MVMLHTRCRISFFNKYLKADGTSHKRGEEGKLKSLNTVDEKAKLNIKLKENK